MDVPRLAFHLPYRGSPWSRFVPLFRLTRYITLTIAYAYPFSAVGRLEITCAPEELVQVVPPAGQTCSQYLSTFISNAGGYITNPDATSECNYCSARTTDQFLQSSFNIFYSHHWRDLGIFVGFIFFNVSHSASYLFFCVDDGANVSLSLPYRFLLFTLSRISSAFASVVRFPILSKQHHLSASFNRTPNYVFHASFISYQNFILR